LDFELKNSLLTKVLIITEEEANKIYSDWIEYVEINDKLTKIFPVIPMSFLPHPIELLEQALNIVAERYWNNGNKKLCTYIQESMCTLGSYKNDEEAIRSLIKDLQFLLDNPEVLNSKLVNLKRSRAGFAIDKGSFLSLENSNDEDIKL
jgi:hypothetical protein